ncbi:MAG: CoA transferase [Candidatus Rokubacteria bacterium]|nr:CoA transferase [Candidatus Rokubacteria bacterium]
MTEPPSALDGLRVLDLTRVLAGPFCTMLLGDMGADVVKVEPRGGDETRAWGPPYVGGESAYFLGVNRNKRGITLDPTTPRGREVLRTLAARSDVLVDNFRAGTLARWGFDGPWFDAHAPRLVRCSITGYGPTGPRAELPGYDFILQAETGLMSISGEPDGEPMKYGVAIVDLATGMLACIAILGALAARERTGRGQQVDLSLFETGLTLLANVASNHLASGRDAGRFGNGHPNIVPYRTYATRAGDAAEAWIARLRAAGVPCGRVSTVAQALADPQALARAMVETIHHPAVGSFRMLGVPFKMAGTPARVRRPPPTLGEHTGEVLGELGLDAAEIARLRADEVI